MQHEKIVLFVLLEPFADWGCAYLSSWQWAGAAYTGEALYQREHAVHDHGIITANGTAPMEFAREVLLALGAAPAEAIFAAYQFHKLGCYDAPMPE